MREDGLANVIAYLHTSNLPEKEVEERARNICSFLGDVDITLQEATLGVLRALTPSLINTGIRSVLPRRAAASGVIKAWIDGVLK